MKPSDVPSARSGGVLSIKNVSIVYNTTRGPLTALRNLDMEVADGEFVAVLGPSGCGKSTLLRVISGLIPVSGGTASISGQPIKGPRKDVGIVFQQPTLLPWKTIRDNILVPIKAQRLPIAKYVSEADRLLDLVGLEKFGHHLPRELSGGMQQRAGIARGLIHDPSVLLMDEPFAALDAMTREKMTMELQSIWMTARKTVLFITHSIPEAVFLADRVVVLSGRPGSKLMELPIPLERPRTLATMASPQFGALANTLRETFGATTPLH